MSTILTHVTPDDHQEFTAVKSVTMELADEASLPEMLDAYKGFLQATGYYIDGNLVVEDAEVPDTTIKIGDF